MVDGEAAEEPDPVVRRPPAVPEAKAPEAKAPEAKADESDEVMCSNTMPTEEWTYRRVMKPSGMTFAKELEHELMIQPGKRTRGGGGGSGGPGTHVTLDTPQMNQWRTVLGGLGSVGQVCDWADTICRVVTPLGGEAARQERPPGAAVPAAAAAGGGSSIGRIVKRQLDRAFDWRMAIEQYALMCTTDPSMSAEQRRISVARISQYATASLTGNNNMVGVPLDGVDSYWLEFSFLHPMVLERVAMPHMTPPIDRESDVYLELWRQVGQPKFPGLGAGSDEFYHYVLATRGTTVDYLDDYGLMEVIDKAGTAFGRKAALLAQRPADLEAAALDMASHLDEAATVAVRMPEGLEEVLTAVRTAVGSGRPMADWLHRLSIWPNAAGSTSSIDRWYSFLMSHWHAADQMVSQYPVALAIATAMANLTGSPPDECMNVSIVVSGPPGCGKTFIGPTVLQHSTRHYRDLGHKSSMAETAKNDILGGMETMDEVRLSELSNEHAASMRETYEFIKGGGYISRSHNFSNTRSSTTTKSGTIHMAFNDQHERIAVTTIANKQYGKVYFTNAPPQSMPEPVARRIATYTLATFSGHGVPTQMTVGHVDTRMRAETKCAKLEDRRSQLQAYDLLSLANVLARTGLLPVTCVAALKVYELAAGPMTRFIQPGPRLKLEKWFLRATTLLDALMDVGAGLYEPDPTTVFRPFVDTLRALRMLTYITEEAAAKAFDLTLGRWTTQAYHAGMPVVCERLRHLVRYEYDADGNPGERRLSSVGFGAVPLHTRYVALRSYFAGVSRDPIERAKHLAVALYTGRHSRDWTLALPDVQVLIFILMRGPPCPFEDPVGSERPLPTLHCMASDDLVVLREFLYDEMVDDRRTMLARAFPPGTVSQMARASLEPASDSPSTLMRETMSREERAALINGSTFTKRNHRVELAREKVVAELLRLHSLWNNKRHAKVGDATSFVDMYLDYMCGTVQNAPTPANVSNFIVHCRRVAIGIEHHQLLDARQKEAVDKFQKDAAGMWMECGHLVQATRDFQTKLRELEESRAVDPRLAERHWAEARVCNPRRMHEGHVQAQVEVGNMSADALEMAREPPLIALDAHIFDKAAREHVQMFTSVCTDEAYAWCAARPEHRQALVAAQQRYLASLGALRSAVRDFRFAQRTMARIVHTTCRFALDYAAFQAWNQAHGGLVYRLRLATVSQKVTSQSGWNLASAVHRNAEEFELASIPPPRVVDFITQVVLHVSLAVVYGEAPRDVDEGQPVTMDEHVRRALYNDEFELPSAARPSDSAADLALLMATARATLFREPVPRLRDGRIIDTYAPAEARRVLQHVTLRRRAALQAARDATVLRLTSALEDLLCVGQPCDPDAAHWREDAAAACRALDADAQAVVLTWHRVRTTLANPMLDQRQVLASEELAARPDAEPYPTVTGRDFPEDQRVTVMQILGVEPLPPLSAIPAYSMERVRECQAACDPRRAQPPVAVAGAEPVPVPAPAPADVAEPANCDFITIDLVEGQTGPDDGDVAMQVESELEGFAITD